MPTITTDQTSSTIGVRPDDLIYRQIRRQAILDMKVRIYSSQHTCGSGWGCECALDVLDKVLQEEGLMEEPQ